jgi:DNA processing protein
VSAPSQVTDRAARAGLSRAFEPGMAAVSAAVASLGAVEVWDRVMAGAPVPALSDAALAGARGRCDRTSPHRDLEAVTALGGRYVVPGDEEWPEHRLSWAVEGPEGVPGLGRSEAPPWGLWLRGPVDLAEAVERSVSLVGARAATAYGSHVASELGFGLADRGWGVVSGGAYGVDGAAHQGALNAGRGPTVAVLACGVDVVYPRGHDRLLGRIAAGGLVVSEVPPGAHAGRVRFLVRNRLIAGPSGGTVVVEAATRSGSLSTARLATRLGRRVMAVPGPITSGLSTGCHGLIREGAVCVTSASDVLVEVGRVGEHEEERPEVPPDPRDGLSLTVRKVLDAVPVRRAAGVASIARTAGVSPLVVQQVLPPLEVAGLLERRPDGWRLTALAIGPTAR